ncbi:hypothetical protein [Peribacillus sp. NPDC056705]
MLEQWKEARGTEEQFDEKIKKNWDIPLDQLKQSHLTGIIQLLNKRKAS